MPCCIPHTGCPCPYTDCWHHCTLNMSLLGWFGQTVSCMLFPLPNYLFCVEKKVGVNMCVFSWWKNLIYNKMDSNHGSLISLAPQQIHTAWKYRLQPQFSLSWQLNQEPKIQNTCMLGKALRTKKQMLCSMVCSADALTPSSNKYFFLFNPQIPLRIQICRCWASSFLLRGLKHLRTT